MLLTYLAIFSVDANLNPKTSCRLDMTENKDAYLLSVREILMGMLRLDPGQLKVYALPNKLEWQETIDYNSLA